MPPRKQVAVFGSFLANDQSPEMKFAEQVGYLLARKGFTVLCGGHGGIANPLVAGVLKGGGNVVGLCLSEDGYPGRSARMNPLITRRVVVDTLTERLEYFSRSDGFIFFSGGIGTLSEFAFVWHSLQLKADFLRPVVLVAEGWKQLLARIRAEQMVKFKYFRSLHPCDRAEDAVAVVADDFALKYDTPDKVLRKAAVLFDFDGTLVEAPEERFVTACENRGYFFPMAEVVESFGKAGRFPEAADARPFFREVSEHLGLDKGVAEAIAGSLGEEAGGPPRLYDDVAPTLRHLRAEGFATGILSRRPLHRLKPLVSDLGVSAWIDFICTPDHPRMGTDGGGLNRVLEAFDLKKDRTVYVGDNYREDYLAPRAIGVDAILLDRHLTYLGVEEAFKIRSLMELTHAVRHP